MQLDISFIEDDLVIKVLAKRLDATISREFKEEILKVFQENSVNEKGIDVLVDLAQIDFIDSSGIGSLVSCLKNMTGKGKLRLSNLNEKVSRLFQLTRMDKVFDIIEDEKRKDHKVA